MSDENGGKESLPTWFEQISQETRSNPEFVETFKGMQKLDDVVKTHLEVMKKAKDTEGMVKIPGEDASDEEYERFLRAIGVPEKPEEYEFEPLGDFPKGFQLSEKDDEWFKSLAYEAGLLPGQANEIRRSFIEKLASDYKRALEGMEEKAQETKKALEKEWGRDAVRNGEMAHRALSTFGGKDLIDLLERAGLGDDPVVLKAFYQIGKAIGEDRLAKGVPRSGPSTYTLDDIYPTMKKDR